MFMAFSASLKSADLSRQVGAVVARENEILATGANDCPRFGGGQYWPYFDEDQLKIVDAERGRDYKRGYDSNKKEQQKIVEEIIAAAGESVIDPAKLREAVEQSQINDLTEYGRIVHAEMAALLACARNHGGTDGADVYCTTFPVTIVRNIWSPPVLSGSFLSNPIQRVRLSNFMTTA